jgi:hypothetical protein
VPAERWPEVQDALAPLGVDVKADEGKLQTEAQVKLAWNGNPLHLFFSQDALHEEMARKVRNVSFEDTGTIIPLAAPEHLVIRKAMLDRTKDWIDIEQIFAATSPLDFQEMEAWLEQMAGTDDPRLAKLRHCHSRVVS